MPSIVPETFSTHAPNAAHPGCKMVRRMHWRRVASRGAHTTPHPHLHLHWRSCLVLSKIKRPLSLVHVMISILPTYAIIHTYKIWLQFNYCTLQTYAHNARTHTHTTVLLYLDPSEYSPSRKSTCKWLCQTRLTQRTQQVNFYLRKFGFLVKHRLSPA